MNNEITEVRMIKNENDQFKHDLELISYPFTRGKIVRFKDQEKAEDYRAQSVTKSYVVMQMPGYNIFLNFAGFSKKPTSYIQNTEIRKHIMLMINWYMLNVLHGNKALENDYKIKKLTNEANTK